jgi:hypothetical protein
MLTQKTLNSFTLDAYRELLAHFQATHEFITFSEAAGSPKPTILLRHDIDYSLQTALVMARLEAEQGVRSTYFVLFSSPFYNVLDAQNIGIPRQLVALGHEVGLHYDVAVMQRCDDPAAALAAQARLLGELSGVPVRSIAMHNPSVSGADIFREAPYVNAYDPRFTQQAAYFSDSCMAWRDAFVRAVSGGDELPRCIQLLIHPCLWTEHAQPRLRKLEAMHAAVLGGLRAEVETARAIWTNHSGVREHEARLERAAEQPPTLTAAA